MKMFFLTLASLMLISAGALAESPNERVHVLQKRDYSVKNKIEIGGLFAMSVDDIFTQHYAGVLSLDYHIDEAFAIEFTWLSCKVPFYMGDKVSDDPAAYSGSWLRKGHSYTDAYYNIKNDAQLSPSNADLAMIGNYWGLNVEFSPIYGKFSLFNWGLARADFYVTAGGGLATTEYMRPDKTWVDTGLYFMGSFGMGFRIFLARWFAIRLDMRDLTFAAKVEGEAGATGTTTETKIRSTLFVMLGVSFLFGGEEPVQIWSPY
ncbi:MAG TPA: outer membrane beta-barrel domain-containing protein [Myxococcota bacterium]|nr:outer membrane beta-barrel domain-containing protein [Myxococcota bacterium]